VDAGSGTFSGYTVHRFTSNGTLTFNAINPVFSGVISGSGSLTVAATDGSVTLAGGNTFSGGTTISGGTLRVGNASTTGTLGTGAVVNNATLEFNRSDAFTFAQNISGTGGLSKLLSNTVTLTGATTYTGATAISAGTLVLQSNAPSTGSSGFSGAGALRIEPAADDFSAGLSLSGWTFASSLGGLTVGKLAGADGTGDRTITLPGAINMAGPVTVYGGNIALNAALTSTAGNINLYASGAVTQTGAITASSLGLQGAGTFTLDNAANSVTTLAGGSSTARLGSLSFRNAAALTIGSVNPTGIYA
jgi:autotransporter-associated beta strand protein